MDDSLTAAIQHHFVAQGWTLSVAESCTGGNLAARLTRLPGSSAYFIGSIVAYSNHMKEKVLGVPAQLIQEHGAVSAQVAEQMANGVLRLTGSDYSLAVTGIAGPGGGNPQKPVGTVWAAIAKRGKETVVWSLHLSGSRYEIIEDAVDAILLRLCKIFAE